MVSILKEAEASIPVKELCRKYAIGNSTFINVYKTYYRYLNKINQRGVDKSCLTWLNADMTNVTILCLPK